MSTTFPLDTSTSRANPTPAPMRRLTVPKLRARKVNGVTEQPIVALTAYTARQAQLLDRHCDLLLIGDSLGQVIYGLPSSVPVTLEMMANHGAAVVRGSYHAVVVVDMPFGSYEQSPAQAFESASFLLKETGCAAVKLEGGAAMAEPLAVAITEEVSCPTIGSGASAKCDGQILVTEDMLGMFERTPRFVKTFGNVAETIAAAAEQYAGEVRARTFPGPEQPYQPD